MKTILTYVLIMTFGNGNSSQKIEGYDGLESCTKAATQIPVMFRQDRVFCVPKWENRQ